MPIKPNSRKTSHKPGSVHPNPPRRIRTDCHLSSTDVTVSVYRSTLQASTEAEENEQPYSLGLHDLSAREVYLASECRHRNGELLPPHFTLTTTLQASRGGLFSAALSVPIQLLE